MDYLLCVREALGKEIFNMVAMEPKKSANKFASLNHMQPQLQYDTIEEALEKEEQANATPPTELDIFFCGYPCEPYSVQRAGLGHRKP